MLDPPVHGFESGRPLSRPLTWLLTAGLLLSSSCADAPARAPAVGADTFAGLVESLSEEGGYFDTDNLISNETSYLHALSDLDRLGVAGGAYLGVGPGQNFSYIAAIRPEIAFILDIRRDNVLQHLLYKALFGISPTRQEYLANLIGVQLPPSGHPDHADAGIDELVEAIDGLPPLDEDGLEALRSRIRTAVDATGVPLDEADHRTILRFHDEFRAGGLDLRFSSHYRSPQPYYPTLRRLLLERDVEGRQRSYLATHADFDFIRTMQGRDRIIPVVGDLAGPTAVRRVGEYLEGLGAPVSAFYTSNVEFYLFRNRSFGRFAENVRSLPLHDSGVVIRSYFNRFRASHPQTLPGYASTQLVRPITDLFGAAAGGTSYSDLIFR